MRLKFEGRTHRMTLSAGLMENNLSTTPEKWPSNSPSESYDPSSSPVMKFSKFLDEIE